LVIGLVGIAVAVGSILVINAINSIDGLLLTYDAMKRRSDNLPEVKAFLIMYPDAVIRYGDKTVQPDGNEWVAQEGIGQVKYKIGGHRGENLLELETVVNRTSGEVIQTRIDCFASVYVQGHSERDAAKEFHHTTNDTDIAAFIENGDGGFCRFPPKT